MSSKPDCEKGIDELFAATEARWSRGQRVPGWYSSGGRKVEYDGGFSQDCDLSDAERADLGDHRRY
jgi:hypothetical protein